MNPKKFIFRPPPSSSSAAASRSRCSISPISSTANKLLVLLANQGHLREITGRAWGRTYVAQAILDAVERTPA